MGICVSVLGNRCVLFITVGSHIEVGRFCLVKKPNPAKAICPEERNQQVLPNCPSDGCYWKIELI